MGLLSNLCYEKGLYTFVKVVERLVSEGVDVEGILAGPVPSELDRRFVEDMQRALAGRLRYVGAVYADSKREFFFGLDAFVFPPEYPTESYGLVVLEALRAGVPVISFGRGCIPQMLEEPSGFIVPIGGDFVVGAAEQVKRWIACPEVHQAARTHASDRAGRLAASAESELCSILDQIGGSAVAQGA